MDGSKVQWTLTAVRYWMDRTRARMADETGASAIEYALIAGLIAAVLITALTDTGTGVRTLFETIVSSLPAAAE